MNKYWVQYQYGLPQSYLDSGECQSYTVVSDFITVGDGTLFEDLESWWSHETEGTCEHEILQVVKL